MLPSPQLWNSDRNSFEKEAFSTKTSNPLRVWSLLKEFVGHCSHHNARTKSLLFSMLEMLLTGSDCFDVSSDRFDSFFPGSANFSKLVSSRNLPSWVKYYGKLESFGKEFRRTKFIPVERVMVQINPFNFLLVFGFLCRHIASKPIDSLWTCESFRAKSKHKR